MVGQSNYIKVMFEAVVSYNDADVWLSIKEGSYIPAAGQTANKVAKRIMKIRYDKALSMLKLGLLWEILTSVRHHTSAKSMYDAVIDMFEGNVEQREIKKDMLKHYLVDSSLDLAKGLTMFSREL